MPSPDHPEKRIGLRTNSSHISKDPILNLQNRATTSGESEPEKPSTPLGLGDWPYSETKPDFMEQAYSGIDKTAFSLQGSDEPSKEPSSNSEGETTEDQLIQSILGIMRLSSYLTIMFTEHGSAIFVDDELSKELTATLMAMNSVIDFVGSTVMKSRKYDESDPDHEVHS